MELDKFESFVKASLKNQKLLTEAVAVANRLKQEISLTREVESYLRQQLTRSQDRNIALQRDINSFQLITNKAKEQEKLIFTLEETIKNLSKIVNETKAEVGLKLVGATAELDLKRKTNALEQQLQEQDGKFNLLKIEQQVILKKKDENIKILEEKMYQTNNTLEKTKLNYNMLKNEFDRVHLTYRKQIMDYEQKLRNYENNQNGILGENQEESIKEVQPASILKKPSNKIANLWDRKVNITWADAARKATILQDCEVSSQNNAENEGNPMSVEHGELPTTVTCDNSEVERPKFKPKVKTSRTNIKAISTMNASATRAPPLEVFPVKNEPNQPKKKRLYSSNSNHFVL